MSIIVALDVSSESALSALLDQLDPQWCRVKVGKELFTRFGPKVVRSIQARGFEVFLDLKFHDIPNTTAQAVLAAADLGVWMVNVHASGGRTMMSTCIERLHAGGYSTQLIGVTVLTSMSDADLQETGVGQGAAEQVMHLAGLAQQCGLHGVVCSAQEAPRLRQALGPDFVLVTPGIRPVDAAADDQQRIVTPVAALQNGATHLVIGRPVTQSKQPHAALHAIHTQLQQAGLI